MYTWSNNQSGDDLIFERLDRGLCNLSWRELFYRPIIKHLEFIGSDHRPLLLLWNFVDSVTPRSFKFERMWIEHEDYDYMVRFNWNNGPDVNENPSCFFSGNLKDMRIALSKWSKEVFPNNRKLINELMVELNICNSDNNSNRDMVKAKSIVKLIEDLWDREELYWAQRSRLQWLKCSDKNTKFFHSTTIQRRQRNKVTKIKNGQGDWLENKGEIVRCFRDYFDNLFDASGNRDFSFVLSHIDRVITDVNNEFLCSPITDIEIKNAVFQLGGSKAPGPDGFSGLFYQYRWQVVGNQLCDLVKDFFHNGFSFESLNITNLVLIPKMENPESVGNFKPISLWNISYKVMSKVVTNRLKDIMPRIISENQRAFFSGRLIQDNILVVHEVFHYSKNKKRGRYAEMAIKMDMNKAYDRVEWDFLAQVLLKMGFNSAWVEKVIHCLDSVSFNLLLSGKKVSSFRPKRGLRQGDPLSPYLFIIMADVLFKMINLCIDKW